MMRLTYSNSALSRNVSAYIGVHVWEHASDTLLMASLVGAEAAVRGLDAAIKNGERVTSERLFLGGVSHSWPGAWSRLRMKTDKGEYVSQVRLVEQDAKDDQGIAHGLIIHKAASDPFSTFALMVTIGENGETTTEGAAFWRLWVSRWSTPGMVEWSEAVWSEVKRKHVTALNVYQRPGQGVTAYKIDMTDDQLAVIVEEGLQKGTLTMPDGPDTDGANLEEVEDVTTYLKTFSKPLARQISARFKPLYVPGESPVNPLVKLLKRPLYDAQADVVQGVALAMRKYKVALIAAEMGTGKTPMGAAVPFLLHGGKGFRQIVMCPPHLTVKWQREIQAVVPGAFAPIVRSLSDLETLVNSRPWKAAVPEYIIISRETMKLGTTHRPAVMMGFRPREASKMRQEKHDWHLGPICPTCGTVMLDKEGAPSEEPFNTQKDSNRKCKTCGDVLWSAGYPGLYRGRALRRPIMFQEVDEVRPLRRWPLADFIKRHLKGWADGAIVDELHEMKAGDSAQGNALGSLAAAVQYVLGLTGTLSGGYATDLFPILYRMRPSLMKAEGFEHHAVSRFASVYGRVERVTKSGDDEDSTRERNTHSKGKKSRTYVKVRPGISPRMYGKFLMPNTAFMELHDLGKVLPSYTEEVELIPMEADLAGAYVDFSRKLKDAVMDLMHKGSKRLLGAYLQALLNYPDKPHDAPPVIDKVTGDTVATPKPLSMHFDRNKVMRLAQICKEEKAAGRKVLCYATATNLRDVQPYLKAALESAGLRVAVMYGKVVKPEAREAWIAQKVKEGADVLICNPALVATGLDLLQFPTIVWFQTGYSTFTLRQASRRSWRLGQEIPVRVIFMAYQETLQESCLRLMGSKLAASMGLEGKWSEDGLQALCESEDMTSALARALVNGLDGTDSAEAIWRKMAPAEVETAAEAPASPAAGEAVEVAPEAPKAPAVEAPMIPGLVAVAASAFFKRGKAKVAPVEGEVAQLAFGF